MRKILAALLVLVFLTLPVNAAEIQKPELRNTTPITAGAVLKEYRWQTSSGNVNISVIKVDLLNPYVQVAAILGAGQFTKRLNVSAMAKNTGAVAAVNGDFFNTQGETVPVGPMVMESRLVSSSSNLENIFALGISNDRKAYIEPFSFTGKVTAPNGVTFELAGLNKTVYQEDPTGEHSHANKLHLYNDLWGGKTRGDDSYTTPTEMLVKDGIVVEIMPGKYFDYAVPKGMYILRSHGIAAKFLVENFKIGDKIDIQYEISPQSDWNMVLGGHSLLINEGKAIPYARYSAALGGVRARTAVGISEDRKTIYLVGAEKNTLLSVGLSLPDLSSFMQEIGVWKALNLDGGGSTTFVTRPLGDTATVRTFEPEQAQERLVANALGIFSNAPAGKLKGLLISGEKLLLINEAASYALKGYDQYYNPVETNKLNIAWKESAKLGTMKTNVFQATKPGSTVVMASANATSVKIPVQVLGKQDLDSMFLTGANGKEIVGSQQQLQLVLRSKAGVSKKVLPNLVDWQLQGIKGSVSAQGVLTIQDTMNSKIGFVVARYQGFSAPLAIQFGGQREVLSLDKLDGISFEVYPLGVSGTLALVNDPVKPTTQVTSLQYNFSNAPGTAAAYLRFDGEGIPIDANADGIALNVYGNNANEWLRAELEDGNGVLQRLDLSLGVNWSGWKTLQLSTQGLVKPVTLKRLYAVVTEVQKNQTNLQGSLLFKALSFTYGNATPEPPQQKLLELIVGQKSMLVDGTPSQMDVAPMVVEGRTLVPIRFISEALGATVLWDGATKNATIIKERSWVDLWTGEAMMVVDGKAIALDVPLQLIKNRTMIPLRAVAESLHLTVGWDQINRKISLQ